MSSIRAASTLFVALLAVAVLASPARAGVVTETYDFTLSNFVDGYGSAASPLASITGEVTLTFDPTLQNLTPNYSVTVESWTAPGNTASNPVGFVTLVFGGTDELWIGDAANSGPLYYATGTDDFEMGIFTTDPSHPSFVTCADAACGPDAPSSAFAAGFATSASGYSSDFWVAQNASVTAVPEPATWTLLVVGLGALGVSLVVRRRGLGVAGRERGASAI